jgi:CobQ-like glutamine amidotransferase family enzyme
MNYQLTLTHLYPQNLNLYGDTGNVICLKRRCGWHNIQLTITNVQLGMELHPGETDIYFIGGGQDSDQIRIVEDFHNLKYQAVNTDINNNVVFLGVCGGYQLMGNNFLMGDGNQTKGLGIIDIDTKAPGSEVKQRCIGNLVTKLNESDYQKIQSIYTIVGQEIPNTLVGFENHSGQTFLKPRPLQEGNREEIKPLAQTLKGFGNNASEGHEGARYKNIFGTYMHGSFLPKNPHIADYLIWLAIVRKYNNLDFKLEQLNDEIEYSAHKSIKKQYS